VSCPWSKRVSLTSRTAVYGPVRTVVWEGRSREAPPYPDRAGSAVAQLSCSRNARRRLLFLRGAPSRFSSSSTAFASTDAANREGSPACRGGQHAGKRTPRTLPDREMLSRSWRTSVEVNVGVSNGERVILNPQSLLD